MLAVVVTFDRLPAHLLGCYGNEWVETPGIDALASQATVFERHLVELPGPAGASHPWWTGRFEFFDPPGSGSLFRTLSQNGVRCRLLSERDEGLPHLGLDSIEHVSGADGLDVAHEAVPFARLVAEGQGVLQQISPDTPELVWLHSAGVPSPWLPPEFFAGLYLDELEDRLDGLGQQLVGEVLAQLRDDTVLTELLLSEPDDEDTDDGAGLEVLEEAFGEAAAAISRFVFAGYVSLLDHWLQKLTATISDVPHDLLFILTAAGGYSFGEQRSLLQDAGAVSDRDDWQFGDQTLQTPLILWQTGATTDGVRLRPLVQPPDIAATLCDWFGIAPLENSTGRVLLDQVEPADATGREQTLHLSDSGEIGLQDEHWFVASDREDVESDNEIDAIPARLYAKPDDFWETNNLVEQSPDECQRLLTLLRDRVRSRTHPTL